ncbi:MAG TPA: FGGY-family carbohydrate kinase [Streptosporangiaceae bacterium]
MSRPAAATVLGIDLGTRGVRAGLYTLDGTLLEGRERPVQTWHPRPGWAEQSPPEVLAALHLAVSEVVAGHAAPVALSVASTAVTAVAVDGADCPAGRSLLWMDTRASAEADEITRTGHPALCYTGGQVSPEWMLPKALWLARHDPGRFAAARRIVDVHDWVIFQLTGRWSLAAATIAAEWCYDPLADGWSAELLDRFAITGLLAGWDVPRLPAGHPAGRLTAAAAAQTGLVQGIPVVQGLMDSYAAALAANLYEPGRLAISIGTSSSYLALAGRSVSDPRLLGPVPEAFGPGSIVQQGGQTSAGAVVEWFSRQLAAGVPLPELDAEAAAIDPGADGLWALDTWQGCRTPHRDAAARGMWGGLTLAHTRGHLFRAALEAVAFGGRTVLETLEEAGAVTRELAVTGGAARSDLWMQMHADVIGRPLVRLAAAQPVTLGAAICAAVGAGAYPDLPAACAAMTSVRPGWLPDPGRRQAYEALYAGYRRRLTAVSALNGRNLSTHEQGAAAQRAGQDSR